MSSLFRCAVRPQRQIRPLADQRSGGQRERQLQITCLRVATNHSIRYHRPMLRVRIRLAMSDDCLALAEMRYRFRAETEWVTETKSLFVRRCTSWMRKHFCVGSCPWRCWVLDDGKRLLGHVCVQLFEKIPNPVKDEPELHAYVTNFMSFRKCGTGDSAKDC
jgi:hypothetical protein